MTKTESIFKLTTPFNNDYQGTDIRALCVCSVGMLRSPTLAGVLLKMGYNVRACGSDVDMALIPISANLINWANIIFFINHDNYKETIRVFKGTEEAAQIEEKKVIFDIEDSHGYNDPPLIRAIRHELIKCGIN